MAAQLPPHIVGDLAPLDPANVPGDATQVPRTYACGSPSTNQDSLITTLDRSAEQLVQERLSQTKGKNKAYSNARRHAKPHAFVRVRSV